jgi:hypothetical protein
MDEKKKYWKKGAEEVEKGCPQMSPNIYIP